MKVYFADRFNFGNKYSTGWTINQNLSVHNNKQDVYQSHDVHELHVLHLLGAQIDENGLDLRVFFQSIFAVFAAYSRLLEPAERAA
jgi:hypothetical protein